jgi:hypothetical protein
VVGKRHNEEATAILVTSNLKWPLLVIEIVKEGNTTHLCMPMPFAAALVHIAVAAPSSEHVEGGVMQA